MSLQVPYTLVSILLLFIFSLYLSGNKWFNKAVTTAMVIIFGIFYVSISVFIGLFPKFAKGAVKSVIVLVLGVLLAAVYLVTYVVPFVGARTESLEDWFRDILYPSYLASQARISRDMMVGIVAENDERNLKFEDSGQYREELSRVKSSGKKRLERGETVLSILLGAVLLGSKLGGVEIFQIEFYGFALSTVVELWLLVIASSIVYRVSVLEFLTYPADVEFDSLQEFDAALSYQKGVTLANSIQVLTIVLIFGWTLANVDNEKVRYALNIRYGKDVSTFQVLWSERDKLR
jgi:hypothetical protein